MNRQGVWGWRLGARVLSAVFVVWVAVAPVAGPVNAWGDVDESQYSAGFSQVLPAWWVGTAVSSLRPFAGASSYSALPAWWHQRGLAALRTARSLQAAVTGMAIHAPLGTAVITKSLRTDEPYTFFAVVTETTGQTDTREAIWTLSPEFGSLSPDVGISTELDGFQVGTTVLTATLETTPTISATARVSFTPGTVAWLSLVPEDEILTAGQSVVYSVDAYDADANVVGDVTGATAFAIDGEAHGIWGGNVYTSKTAGAWGITGTHEYAPGQWVSGTAELTVRPSALTTLTITPDPVTVAVGTARVFTATGTDLLGNPVLVTPTWTALGGEIDPGPAATTVFTAQTTPADGLLVTATQGTVSTTAAVTVVHGPLYTFAFSPSLITTQTAGKGIPLALLARDEYGNLATRYNGTVDLSVSSGSIVPEAVDLAEGKWQGVVTLTQAAESVYVVASDDPITGRSNDFAVVPAALDHIRINSAPDNGGAGFGYPVEVGTHVMDVYDVYPVWGAGYDQFENYRGDLTVTWGLTGVLAYGSITPTPAISATMIPAAVLSGTGVITASYVPSGFVDSTGLFTVDAPWLVIRKARTWPTTDAVPAGTENMEYTIVFSNVGSADAKNVRITETYDSNVSYSVAVPRPDTGTDDIWTLPVLRKDEPPQTILVFVDVGSSLAPGTVLTNLVEIGGSRVQAAGFSVTTVVTSAPALDVSLTDLGNDPVDVGDPFDLQVTYVNSGTAPVDDIVLTLTLDAYVSFVNAQVAPVIAPTPGNGNVGRWELGSLAGESESSFLIWLDVDTFVPDQYALSNDVVINSAQTKPAYDMELTTVNAPQLALSKLAAPSPAIAYDRLEYTLIYSNVGHLDAPNLIITDRFPADVNYLSCQPAPCYRSGDVVTWEREQGLGAGMDAEATLVVDVHRNLDSGTILTNVARVRVFDEPRYSAADTITTTVLSSPSLVLSISDGKDWAEAGDELVYAINTNNAGSGRAYDTMIVAHLPSTEHVTYQGCLPSNVCERVGEQVIYDLGTVSGGAGSMVFMNVAVLNPLPAGARAITASATISTVTPGDPPEDNVAQDVDQIITRPDLVVTADYQDFLPKPGKRVTYTVHYSNEGRMLALGVVLTATKAQYAEFDVQASDPRWELQTNDSVRFEAGDLDFGQSAELSLVTTLPDPPVGHFTTVMTNFDAYFEVYEAGGSGEDADLETNTFYAPLGVPNLVITEVDVDPVIRGGKPGYLTVTVENKGYGRACGSFPGEIACRGANVDVFVNPTTEPKSFPVANYGDCFVNFDPIQPGLTRSLLISFTSLDPGGQSGLCKAGPIVALWLKADNWTTDDQQPSVEEYGLVPEFNEWDNVIPVPFPDAYLPIIIRKQ
jgi:uncharacterized repeat protein (TIGR01451 family)